MIIEIQLFYIYFDGNNTSVFENDLIMEKISITKKT